MRKKAVLTEDGLAVVNFIKEKTPLYYKEMKKTSLDNNRNSSERGEQN